MRKSVSKFLLAFMLLGTLLGFGVQPVSAAKGDDLEVKIAAGYNDVYKIGFPTPVNVTIKNNGADIEGEVEIQVPSSNGKYFSYVRPISLQKDAEKVITINIPVSTNRTKYTVNIYHGREKVYEDSITMVASNNVTAFIGVLSDDFDSLSYINTVPVSAGVSFNTKTIRLDEKNFPEDIFTLNAFDILVINDYDTSKFSKVQYDILKQWVNNGGTLLLATGSKYNKTLSVFKDDFIIGAQNGVREISTSKIYELATNGDSKNITQLDALSLNIKDSEVLLEEDGVALVQSLKRGKGIVGVVAFDLGQAPFVNWNNNTAFSEKLLGIINPQTMNTNGSERIQRDPYAIRNVVNQFSEMSSAKTSSFYIILFIYIAVAAPLSYIVLKKLDKREWMWISVPAFAIIFAFFVYVSGSGTRMSEISTNIISFLNIDQKGNASAVTYAGIFNANKTKVIITGQSGEKILPLSDGNYYRPSNQEDANDVLEARIFAVPDGGVEYRNSSLLETRILQVQESTKNIGAVETNLTLKDQKIIGEIKNSTNLDLIDCLIISPGGYYKIDSLKSGESAELDSASFVRYGNIHEMIQQVFRQYNSNISGMSEEERARYMDLRQEGEILQMMYNYGNEDVIGVNFIGFSKTALHAPLMVNGQEAKKYERNIISFPVELSFETGDAMNYPLGFVPFSIENNSIVKFDSYNNMLYGQGSVEILYTLDKRMKPEEIEISRMNSNTKMSTPLNKYNIFNIESNKFEPLEKEIISGEELNKYLSPDNTIRIKYSSDGEEGNIPQMAARGLKK